MLKNTYPSVGGYMLKNTEQFDSYYFPTNFTYNLKTRKNAIVEYP